MRRFIYMRDNATCGLCGGQVEWRELAQLAGTSINEWAAAALQEKTDRDEAGNDQAKPPA